MEKKIKHSGFMVKGASAPKPTKKHRGSKRRTSKRSAKK